MQIDILTLFPQMFEGFLAESIVGRAIDRGYLRLQLIDLRRYALNKHGQVDDYPYGGGAGMVLRPEPIEAALREQTQAAGPYDAVLFPTPDARPLQQSDLNRWSMLKRLLIIAGHYKGLDQRVRDTLVTEEVSLGDYVLTGGELPAAVITDGLARLLPGVLGDETSALGDSFQDGLLDGPHYTRPAVWQGKEVPEVLKSGDHGKIAQWRFEQALEKTRRLRPDLLEGEE